MDSMHNHMDCMNNILGVEQTCLFSFPFILFLQEESSIFNVRGCGESHLYGIEGPLYYLKNGTVVRWSPARCKEEVYSRLVSCRLSYLYLAGIYVFAASQRAKTINLAAICTTADYNTRPLDTIYSNFIDALPAYCSENNKRLIHLSTCEEYGRTIGSFLPTDHHMRQVFGLEEKINISSHFDEDGDCNGAART